MRVETMLQGAFDTGGPIYRRLEDLAAAARLIEDLGFDGCTAAEVGHDPSCRSWSASNTRSA